MSKKCNPSNRRGDRNLFCSNYNFCLDQAISKDWNSWNCRKCEMRFNRAVDGQKLSITSEEIVEYGLAVQPLSLEYILSEYDFNGNAEVATIY